MLIYFYLGQGKAIQKTLLGQQAKCLNLPKVQGCFSSSLIKSNFNMSSSYAMSKSLLMMQTVRGKPTVNQLCKGQRKPRFRACKTPALNGGGQKKGIVTKVYTRSPKKPNSGVRKVCKVKVSTGFLVEAYIPGEGHNLQEYSVVAIRGGRKQDLPGCKYRVVRGRYDCQGVKGRKTARSKYGTKKNVAAAATGKAAGKK